MQRNFPLYDLWCLLIQLRIVDKQVDMFNTWLIFCNQDEGVLAQLPRELFRLNMKTKTRIKKRIKMKMEMRTHLF